MSDATDEELEQSANCFALFDEDRDGAAALPAHVAAAAAALPHPTPSHPIPPDTFVPITHTDPPNPNQASSRPPSSPSCCGSSTWPRVTRPPRRRRRQRSSAAPTSTATVSPISNPNPYPNTNPNSNPNPKPNPNPNSKPNPNPNQAGSTSTSSSASTPRTSACSSSTFAAPRPRAALQGRVGRYTRGWFDFTACETQGRVFFIMSCGKASTKAVHMTVTLRLYFSTGAAHVG